MRGSRLAATSATPSPAATRACKLGTANSDVPRNTTAPGVVTVTASLRSLLPFGGQDLLTIFYIVMRVIAKKIKTTCFTAEIRSEWIIFHTGPNGIVVILAARCACVRLPVFVA